MNELEFFGLDSEEMYESGNYKLNICLHRSLNLAIYTTLIIFKNFHSFENIRGTVYEFNVLDDELFEDEILNKGYLRSALNRKSWQKHAINFSLNELYLIAGKTDLSDCANKPEIVNKLADVVDLKSLDWGYWTVSYLGNKFIETHDYIRFYMRYLFEFDFFDFEEYCILDESNDNRVLDYLSRHMEEAIMQDDLLWFVCAMSAYNIICCDSDVDVFDSLLIEFCIRTAIGPDDVPFTRRFDMFDLSNFKNIQSLAGNYTYRQIDDLFNKFYLPYSLVEHDELLSILHMVLFYDDLESLSRQLCEKYYV